MRFAWVFALAGMLLLACDDSRVYEKNVDFDQHMWLVGHKPEFDFQIADTTQPYNLYCNIRNSVAYPYSRLFFTYYLQDSIGLTLKKDLVNYTLFDAKTGKPEGASGLGDIYDQQIPILKNHKFSYVGTHKIKFEQFMRRDSLEGIFAVGVRIEKAVNEK
jgi:gliding motility-associated lipoprotein GldH